MSDKHHEQPAEAAGQDADQMSQHDHHPSPLVKPNSNLPRNLRARVGQLVDDVPKGKHQAQPQHHFAISRAEHSTPAQLALNDKAAVQDKLKELEKTHNTAKHHGELKGPTLNNQPVYAKTVISNNNKLMDSRHRHGDAVGKTHRGMDDGSRANAN